MPTFGAKALTRIATASQAAFGTAAAIGTATGEILFNETIGSLDLGVTVDLGETVSVGKRTAIQASQPTITGKAPILTIAEGPASMRTLPLIFDAIGATTAGAGPYTWTYSPTQGDVDTLVFYSFLGQRRRAEVSRSRCCAYRDHDVSRRDRAAPGWRNLRRNDRCFIRACIPYGDS